MFKSGRERGWKTAAGPQSRPPFWFRCGEDMIVAGIALLSASLIARHFEALHIWALIVAFHWIGAVLVVVGIGRILFLEDRDF